MLTRRARVIWIHRRGWLSLIAACGMVLAPAPAARARPDDGVKVQRSPGDRPISVEDAKKLLKAARQAKEATVQRAKTVQRLSELLEKNLAEARNDLDLLNGAPGSPADDIEQAEDDLALLESETLTTRREVTVAVSEAAASDAHIAREEALLALVHAARKATEQPGKEASSAWQQANESYALARIAAARKEEQVAKREIEAAQAKLALSCFSRKWRGVPPELGDRHVEIYPELSFPVL